jgi:hypothetical protein
MITNLYQLQCDQCQKFKSIGDHMDPESGLLYDSKQELEEDAERDGWDMDNDECPKCQPLVVAESEFRVVVESDKSGAWWRVYVNGNAFESASGEAFSAGLAFQEARDWCRVNSNYSKDAAHVGEFTFNEKTGELE